MKNRILYAFKLSRAAVRNHPIISIFLLVHSCTSVSLLQVVHFLQLLLPSDSTSSLFLVSVHLKSDPLYADVLQIISGSVIVNFCVCGTYAQHS